MRSHFAENAVLMTIIVQRLDPRWRGQKNSAEVKAGRLRGDIFRRETRGPTLAAFALAGALALPGAAYAAGAQPPVPQIATPAPEPAKPVEAAPAPVEKAPMQRGLGGMVRYEKPIFHNGHMVLWHGAWRDGGHAARQSLIKPTPARVEADAPPAAPPHDIIILTDGADFSSTRMAAEFAQAMQNGDVHVKTVAGKTSVAALGKAVAGDSADLAIVPMDSLSNSADKAADLHARAPYVARLAAEPIALIAPRTVTDIRQLAGRKVNVAAADGATAASAAIVFSRLNIAPTMTNEAIPDALGRLARGEIDAVFVVGANDSKVLADFGKDGRFHVIAIPYAPALQALYCPMRLTAHDEGNLIGADEKVDTIGVPMALLAIDAGPDSPRAGRIGPLAERLFSQFDQSLGALSDSRWSEVNLAARIPGWPRLGAAQAWLDQNQAAPNPALEKFRGAAETAAAGGDGPHGTDSDRLYESLMKMSGAQ
jgi:TRAP-type uncharacterized transport system substrate-binding protein